MPWSTRFAYLLLFSRGAVFYEKPELLTGLKRAIQGLVRISS
jgi:hypothetical protein